MSSAHQAQTRPRVNIIIDACEEQIQTQAQDDSHQCRRCDPPPDSCYQCPMLVCPEECGSDRRGGQIRKPQNAQCDLKANRPQDVVNSGGKHNRHYEGKMFSDRDPKWVRPRIESSAGEGALPQAQYLGTNQAGIVRPAKQSQEKP